MYKEFSEVSVGSVGKKQKLFFCEQKDTESPKSLCKNLGLQVFGNNSDLELTCYGRRLIERQIIQTFMIDQV